jgi:hypothetical protein
MTIDTSRREKSTLRKALITITAVAAMCLGSTAMAAAHGGGGHAGGFGGGFGGGHIGGFGGGHIGGFGGGFGGGHIGGFGGAGISAAHGGGAAFAPRTAAPMFSGRVHDFDGNSFARNTFARGRSHDHFNHHRFGYGFGGPYYDYDGPYCDYGYGYGYDSCCIDDGVQCYAYQY